MPSSTARTPIEVAETMVRLYVFLTQYLDRCLDEAARHGLSDEELHEHLSRTRSEMMEILAVNPVVKGKVEKECEQVLAMGTDCLKDGSGGESKSEDLKAERALLRNKTLAMSDLLAVLRAL